MSVREAVIAGLEFGPGYQIYFQGTGIGHFTNFMGEPHVRSCLGRSYTNIMVRRHSFDSSNYSCVYIVFYDHVCAIHFPVRVTCYEYDNPQFPANLIADVRSRIELLPD